MIKKSLIALATLAAFAFGAFTSHPVTDPAKYASVNFIVSNLPTLEKRGDTQVKFSNEFLEIYYHKNHGAFACYFDLNSEVWRDMQTGYEI